MVGWKSITEDEMVVRYRRKVVRYRLGIGVYDFWAKILGLKDDNT